MRATTSIPTPHAFAAASVPPSSPTPSTPTSSSSIPAYERAFRAWSEPHLAASPTFDEPHRALTYAVYTAKDMPPVRLGSSPSIQSAVAAPKASLAARAFMTALGVCVVLGTAAAILLASTDDAPASAATAAAPPPPIAPLVVEAETIPTTASLAPAIVIADDDLEDLADVVEPAPAAAKPTAKPAAAAPKPSASSPKPAPSSLRRVAPPPNPYDTASFHKL